MSEQDQLKEARERVSKGENHSSLIKWTLSKEWTQAPLKTRVRGDVWLSGQKAAGTCDSCAGEIDAQG